jgi:multidrug efflux pump subunit AcrA (membrane-fusion protein)
MMRAGMRVLLASALLTIIFAFGAAAGIFLYPQRAAESDWDDHDHAEELASSREQHDDHDDEHEEEDHVALTKQAFENLDLVMGPVSKGDYWKSLLVPARVVEIPGRSNLFVSAPVTGVIEDVRVLPGQSLSRTEPLFTMRLTDEALIDAQAKLLEALTAREVAEQKSARLRPLIESGAVSGTRSLELDYELKQLEVEQSTLLQEIRNRGLPPSMIDTLLEDRELATTLNVYPPTFLAEESAGSEDLSSGFSVEDLMVHPGMSLARGEPLCTISYHARLYVEGTAFEDDLPALDRIAENDWKVTLEPHGDDEPDNDPICLSLLRVDNHVDEETQTVKFFIELPNEVTRIRRSDARLFEQWRFRPGQRMHLRLPVEKWENQVTLPVEAVVVDGPNVFVFAEHHHEESGVAPDSPMEKIATGLDEPKLAAEEDDHDDEHDAFIELEPVPVRLLYRDDQTVVIADDGQIAAGVPIALNHAYKLYLAMKMQSGGGGHHHHDH